VRKRPLNPAYLTPALEKGLDILELLAAEPGGLTKAEIARKLNRTYSEIFRMLVCLEKRGYISHPNGDELYQLTLKLFQMAQEHPPAKRMITEALPFMQRSAEVTAQSCHLAVVDDGQVVILAQVDAPASQGLYVRAGSTVDLMQATSGYVYLAFQPPDARARIIARWRERSRKKVPADLEEHLRRIRQIGYEERPSYKVAGIINCCSPILDTHGHTAAVLTVPYIERLDNSSSLEIVRKELKQVTAHITRAIGGKVPHEKGATKAHPHNNNIHGGVDLER
jgi:DNA-binding IclR family transcriptional regulator